MATAPQLQRLLQAKSSRLARLVLGVGLALALGGCVLFGGPDVDAPTYLRATGRGEAPGRERLLVAIQTEDGAVPGVLEAGGNFPGWAFGTLQATGRAPVPSPEEAGGDPLLLARLRAREAALENLALQIANLKAPESGTVGDFLRRRPEKRETFETLLREAAETVETGQTASGDARVTLEAPLRVLALVGWGVAPAEPQDPGASPAWAALRETARAEAEREARRSLRIALEALRIYPNYTVGERAAADPAARERVETALKRAEPRDVRHPEPGVCEVDLALDAEPLIEALRQ